jgi:hypothetical protein
MRRVTYHWLFAVAAHFAFMLYMFFDTEFAFPRSLCDPMPGIGRIPISDLVAHDCYLDVRTLFVLPLAWSVPTTPASAMLIETLLAFWRLAKRLTLRPSN